MLRINRLITIPILQLVRNIGRKGHLSEPVQDLFEYTRIRKADQPVSVFQHGQDFSLQQ